MSNKFPLYVNLSLLIGILLPIQLCVSVHAQKLILGEFDQNQKEVSQELYENGLKSFEAGELEKARTLFEQALKIDPDHKKAALGVQMIHDLNKKQAPIPVEKIDLEIAEAEIEPPQEIEIKPKESTAKFDSPMDRYLFHIRQGKDFEDGGLMNKALNSYKTALTFKNDSYIQNKVASIMDQIHEENKFQAQEFYLKALAATQRGEKKVAYDFCQRALELNPKFLQAQRMFSRLKILNNQN